MSHPWTIIRNPVSASGKARKAWPAIEAALQSAELLGDVHVTQYAGHAVELAQQAIASGSRRLLAVGGDGTAHEVANGILSQPDVPTTGIRLGQIPIGTGNDWGRTMGIPHKLTDAIEVLKAGQERLQDVGRVDYTVDGAAAQRYFINVAGMGYDGLVTEVSNARKAEGKGGAMGYVSALIGCLVRYQAQAMEVYPEDGDAISKKVFSIAVGIGNYNGGGMKPCPKAVPDDGLLDLTLIGDLPKLVVVRNVPRLFSGTFIKNKAVSLHRSPTFRIETEPDNPIEVDGESIGSGPCTFTCLSRQLRVVGTLKK